MLSLELAAAVAVLAELAELVELAEATASLVVLPSVLVDVTPLCWAAA